MLSEMEIKLFFFRNNIMNTDFIKESFAEVGITYNLKAVKNVIF